MKRFTFALVASFFFISTTSAETEVLSSAALEAYASKDPNSIFDDPTIKCRLTELLGKDTLNGLQANMELMSLESKDELGAYPFPGGIRGLYTISEGFILLHPDGRMWVGYLHDDRLEYFTNDPASAKRFPASFEKWAERLSDAKVEHHSQDNGKLAAALIKRCSPEKLKPEIAAFNARRAGTLCDKNSEFSQFAVVTGEEKVHFRDSKSYLVPGDIVQLTDVQHEGRMTECARYTDTKGRDHIGMLPTERVTLLEEEVLEARKKEISPTTKEWIGKWSDGFSELQIIAEKPNRLHVTGTTANGAHTGEIDDILEIEGKWAGRSAARMKEIVREKGEDELDCNLSLFRFNNGIFATDDGRCGGVGVSFYGFYQQHSLSSLGAQAEEVQQGLEKAQALEEVGNEEE